MDSSARPTDSPPAGSKPPSDSWGFGKLQEGPCRLPSKLGAGERVGPFEVRALLGHGGMARVYRALDTGSGREVALKLLRGNLEGPSRARFLREGELTAALEHPGIVRVHSAGEVEGQLYLAYELIEGGHTLERAFEELDLERRLDAVAKVAEAVGHAHANGVVHRDLKPQNVLVEGDRIRVADFGLATARGLERLTETGNLVGTPLYMAPEQFTGERDRIGPPTDVWALGAILYECLTGERPFPFAILIELSAAVVMASPPRPREHAPSISLAVEAVCMRALSKAPGDRFADGVAFAAALRAARAAPAPRPRRSGLVALAGALVASCLLLAAWTLAERSPGLGAQTLRQLCDSAQGDPAARVDLEAALNADLDHLDPLLVAEAHQVLAQPLPGADEGELVICSEHARASARLAPSAAASRSLARLLHQLARHEASARCYERAYAASGDPSDLLAQARCLAQAGQTARSVDICRRFLDRRPRDVLGLRLLIRSLLSMNRGAEARATLDAFSNGFAGPNVAVLDAQIAEFSGADPLPRLQAACRTWKDHPAPRVALAERLLLAGEPLAAWAALRPPLPAEAGSDALELERCLRALHDVPDDPQSLEGASERHRLAAARWHLARARRAIGFLWRLGASAPWREEARAALHAGRTLATGDSELAGRVERTLADLSKLPDAAPLTAQQRAAEELYQQAFVELDMAHALPATDSALARYDEVLALDPSHVRARYARGRALFMRGRGTEGLEACLWAVERAPALLGDLCGSLLIMGALRGGLSGDGGAELLLDLRTSSAPPARAFLLALAVEWGGRDDLLAEALAELNALLDREPGVAWVWALRGLLFVRTNQLLRAERDLEVASSVDPRDGFLAFCRAVLLAARQASSRAVLAQLEAADRGGFKIRLGPSALVSRYPALEVYLPPVSGR